MLKIFASILFGFRAPSSATKCRINCTYDYDFARDFVLYVVMNEMRWNMRRKNCWHLRNF